MENIADKIVKELRSREIKSIKMVFWNHTQGNLSIFYKDGKIINYPKEGVLDSDITPEQIVNDIINE